MRNNSILLSTTTALILLSGCQTSLQSLPDNLRTASNDTAVAGATYSLPMLTFDLTVTRSLESCGKVVVLPPAVDGGKGNPIADFWLGAPSIGLKGEAKPEMMSGDRYRYDPAKLSGPSKTTNFKMEFFKGSDRIKSINSTMEDQTGPILADITAAGLAVASIALGPGTAAIAAGAGAGVLKAAVAGADHADGQKSNRFGFESARTAFHVALDQNWAAAALTRAPTLREQRLQALIEVIEASTTERSMVVCTDSAAVLLTERSDAVTAKKKAAEELRKLSREAEGLVALARIRKLTDAKMTELQDKFTLIDTKLREADAAQVRIDDADEKLVLISKSRWPRNFAETGLTRVAAPSNGDAVFKSLLQVAPKRLLVDPIVLSEKLSQPENKVLRDEFAAWVADYVWPDGKARFKAADRVPAVPGCIADKDGSADVDLCLSHQLPVAVKLAAKPGTVPPECDATNTLICARIASKPINARDDVMDKGLFYRVPVPGSVRMCRADPEPPASVVPAPAPTCLDNGDLINTPVSIPQLGQLRFLSVKNDIFESSGVVVNFEEDGTPTDMSFVTAKAAAASAASGIANSAKAVDTYVGKRREETKADAEAKQKQADADTAKAKAAQAETDIATRTANKKLADDLQSEADIAKARLNKFTLEACLQQAITVGGVPATCPAG